MNIGIPPFAGNIDASKGKESERQQTLQLTDPAYFNVLYQYLTQQGKIRDITASSLQTRETLEVGQFVEMRGLAEQPIVESWVNRVRALFSYFERNAAILSKVQTQSMNQQKQKGRNVPQFSSQQIKTAKEMLDLLIDTIEISRQDPRKTFVRMTNDNQAYSVCCGLLPEFVILPLESVFPSQIRVLGRVDRLLNENETWKIVNFLQVNQAVPTNQLLQMLNSFNSAFGQKQIREEDLQLQYPDIFITPIAIYR